MRGTAWIWNGNGKLSFLGRIASIIMALIAVGTILFAEYKAYIYSNDDHKSMTEQKEINQRLSDKMDTGDSLLQIHINDLHHAQWRMDYKDSLWQIYVKEQFTDQKTVNKEVINRLYHLEKVIDAENTKPPKQTNR